MKQLTIESSTGSLLVDTVTTTRTAKGADMYVRWVAASSAGGLFDKYDRPSKKKAEALEEIRSEMVDMGGTDLRVTGGNTYTFSCAYRLVDKDGRNWVIYHSKTNVSAIAF